MTDHDDLALPRAIRGLRNELRATLVGLEISPDQRGWWDEIKARERDIIRRFSELRAEQPTAPSLAHPLTPREPRDDPFGDEDE